MIVVYVGQFAMFVVDEVYILVVGSIDKYAGVGQMIDEAYKVGFNTQRPLVFSFPVYLIMNEFTLSHVIMIFPCTVTPLYALI